MCKEILIIIIVVILILSLDIITNNYTKETVDIMSNKMEILKEYLFEENKEEAEKQIQDIKEEWEKRDRILAYYLEHDELEKVKTQLTSMSAFCETEEYSEVINNTQLTTFILKHIQEKEELNLESIF